MSTFLSKLFKPKWQSRNPDIRLQAIAALDRMSIEAQSILQSLAESDPEARVRHQAISQLGDSGFLIGLYHRSDDPQRQAIEQRLQELARIQSLTLYDLIDDSTLLAHLINRAATPDQHIPGLGRIEDPTALASIAIHAKTSRMRQAAAELLEAEPQLMLVQQACKSKDKQVFRIVKDKLVAIRARQQQETEQQQRIDRLHQQFEELARTESTLHYEARLGALTQRWQELASVMDEARSRQIRTLLEQCSSRQQSLSDARRREEEQLQQTEASGHELAATLHVLSDTLDRLKAAPASTGESPALDALLKTQEIRWHEATRVVPAERTAEHEYRASMHTLRDYQRALKSVQEHSEMILSTCAQIGAGQSDADRLASQQSALREVSTRIDWPSGFPAPDCLQQLASALGQAADLRRQCSQDSQQARRQVEALIQELDQLLDQRLLKASSDCHRKIQSLLGQLSSRDSQSLQATLTLRQKQLAELREWQGFASLPHQQALVDAMEQLASTSLDPALKLERIKTMQQEWKALGGTREPELWQRFKSAADRAYEPVRCWQEEQDRLRTTNLDRRQTLIRQLQEFVDGNDWQHADWKAVEQIARQAREDWKQAWPVPQREHRPLQSSFNALLKQLDRYLDEERTRNESRKQELVDQARALTEQTDLRQAMEQAKQLQQQWQQIGITGFRRDRQLWQDFREACNAVFARRDQQRTEIKEALAEATRAADALIGELQQATTEIAQLDPTTLDSVLGEFRRRYRQLPDLKGPAQEQIKHRFDTAVAEFRAAQARLDSIRLRAQWQEALRRSALCHDELQTPGTLGREEAFAAQVELSKELDRRQLELWQAIRSGGLGEAQKMDPDRARDLVLQCEIAAGLPSPDQDRGRRMQLQVSRLAEGLSSGNEVRSREDQLGILLTDWCGRAGLDETTLKTTQARLSACLTHLFG
jgi:hypothetical protein